MTQRLSALYNSLVLGHPVLIIVLMLGAFIYFAFYIPHFKLDASADALLLENDEDLRIFREINERYQTREFLFVTFTPFEDLFTDQSLNQIKSLREELKQLQGVDSVLSLADAPLVKIIGGKLSEVVKNYRTLENPDVDRNKAKQELLESPIFKNLIISADGQTTALQVNLEPDQRYHDLLNKRNRMIAKKHSQGLDDNERQEYEQILLEYEAVKNENSTQNHDRIEQIRSIIEKYKPYGALHLGGLPMVTDDMITFIKNDLIVFGFGIFVFLLVMLSVIFRAPRWVMLPLLSCIYAGVVMVGFLGLVGWGVTVISSNFISLMLIITMSMNVHLVVRYRQLRLDHPDWDQRELVFKTARFMVWPCLYTALTTMIGFASLVVSGIKPVIDFGWMMTIGLGVTFITSFLLFPSLLVLMDKPHLIHSRVKGEVPFTAALASYTDNHGNIVLVISAVLAAISLFGMSKLKVENSFINYFSDSTEIYQGLKLIDEKLGGTTTLDIILKFDKEKEFGELNAVSEEDADDEFDDLDVLFGAIESDPADAWFTDYKVDRIKEVHDYLDSLPAIGKVLSIASVLRLAEDLNQGIEFDTFELAIINKRMPDKLKASMITPFISIDNNEARITSRVKDSLKDLRRNELLMQINREIKEKFNLTDDDFKVSGLLVLYNNMLQSLFKSQIMTLGVVMLGIALMLLALFQSVKLAIIGIIPNILAAGIILGLMGLFNIPLDMMTITIAAITIGIAVDNSIHYIYRFREELTRKGEYIETLHYCHANIGRAVFYTAITIIVGFSILIMSNFIPTIYFGVLTAFAMFIALLAALTLLPKLILIWRPF